MMRHALLYASKGLRVFPCVPRDKEPATPHGCRDATTDGALIRVWWAQNPRFNVAVATGAASGIFVVDIDSLVAERALAEYGTLPETVEQITADGRHLFFRYPPQQTIRNSVSKLAEGVDIRGDGGYVLLPPSVHPSGHVYCWSVDSAGAFAEAPPWLLQRIAATGGNGNGAATPPEEWRALVRAGIIDGTRNATLTRLAGHFLRRRVDPFVALEILQSFNVTHCLPPLPEKEVALIVDSIAGRELKRRSGT